MSDPQSSYPKVRTTELIEEFIEAFNKQEKVFGESFSSYGSGARDALLWVLGRTPHLSTPTAREPNE